MSNTVATMMIGQPTAFNIHFPFYTFLYRTSYSKSTKVSNSTTKKEKNLLSVKINDGHDWTQIIEYSGIWSVPGNKFELMPTVLSI